MSLAETDGRTEADDRPIARAVAILLLMGVGLSATVIAVGLALLVLTGQTGYPEPPTPGTLRLREGPAVFPTTLGDVLRGAAMKPFAVIELGLLLLIATPVLRVAASVVLFIREGDRRYTAITAIVLVLLLVSIFWIG